ncbi:MAG: hypothetical protein QOF94_2090, partial [Acidobacteriaceae bacterium]
VTVRFLILSWGLLLILAGGALAAGEYQSTKNGKTMVWNSAPKAGDVATWNGDRDREGYASGFGTLTWYTAKSGTKASVYGIYYGNMVRGKFEGPVNVHVKTKTAHAIFTDGVRTSRWVGGPAPSFKVAQKPPAREPPGVKEEAPSRPTPKLAVRPKPSKPESTQAPVPEQAKTEPTPEPTAPVVAEKRDESVPQDIPAATPEPPLEKPSPSVAPVRSPRPVTKKPPAIAPNQKMRDKYDDSLRALVGPPSSLRADSIPKAPVKAAPTTAPEPTAEVPAPTAAATPRAADLGEEDVIELADAEALAQGYDLGNYLSPKLDYSKAKERWTVFYDSKTAQPNEARAKSLVVAVEDKTKKTFVASPK